MSGARASYANGCAGKERHVSRAAAEAVAALSRVALVPYTCRHCAGWHLAGVAGHRIVKRLGTMENGRGASFEKLRHHLKHAPRPRRANRPVLAQGTEPALAPVGCVAPGEPVFADEIAAARAAREAGATRDRKLWVAPCHACAGCHLVARSPR